jgi:hypothetical protein
VGKEVQVRVKPDRNDDGEYRPRVGKLLALAEDAGEEPDEPDDEPEEEEEEEDGDEGVDLDELDRKALKAFIKDNELDITVKKGMSDDDIRAAITEATSEDDDEEEPEEESEEDDDEDSVDLDELDRSALKKFIKDNELSVTVKKGMSDDDIRAAIAEAAEESDDEEDDDEEEEEGDEKDEAPDYNSWSQTKLKAELKERGLKLKGEFTKRKAVNVLKKDDASDDEPF